MSATTDIGPLAPREYGDETGRVLRVSTPARDRYEARLLPHLTPGLQVALDLAREAGHVVQVAPRWRPSEKGDGAGAMAAHVTVASVARDFGVRLAGTLYCAGLALDRDPGDRGVARGVVATVGFDVDAARDPALRDTHVPVHDVEAWEFALACHPLLARAPRLFADVVRAALGSATDRAGIYGWISASGYLQLRREPRRAFRRGVAADLRGVGFWREIGSGDYAFDLGPYGLPGAAR